MLDVSTESPPSGWLVNLWLDPGLNPVGRDKKSSENQPLANSVATMRP